jgi:hypothetical protein
VEHSDLTDTRFIYLPNIPAPLFSLSSLHIGNREKETQMKKIKFSARLVGWIEFGWLLLSNPGFQAARDKRRAFYEYQMGKHHSTPCY